MSKTSKYEQRGVSASKSEVHEAIKGLDKGLFPYAFCKILPDIAGGDEQYVNIMHADTAGTKTSLAYIYWKETSDLSVWKGIAQDAIVMNLDDMGCVGVTDDILLSNTIGRNKNLISGDVIKALIEGSKEFIDMLTSHGVGVHQSGGETADVGDIVRTIDVGYTAFARISKDKIINNQIKGGQVIVGISSAGQASYENHYNGGMGSNGLTSARHDVFAQEYRNKYPESYDPLVPKDLIYSGSKLLTEKVTIEGQEMNFGKLVLSPTRTYLPLLNKIIKHCRPAIHGIIHNTGGAHTKVKKFAPRCRIVKDNLLEIPPLFHLIQEESQTPWSQMFEVFNCGTRLEVYTVESSAQEIIDMAASFDIDAQVIGYVEDAEQSEVKVLYDGEEYVY